MEYALTNGMTGTISTGSSNDYVYMYGGYGNSASTSVSVPYCAPKENNGMRLYKVFLVRIDNREVTEVNVAARDQIDAFLKAFLAKQISEVDDYDKHAQFICDLTEDDED